MNNDFCIAEHDKTKDSVQLWGLFLKHRNAVVFKPSKTKVFHSLIESSACF